MNKEEIFQLLKRIAIDLITFGLHEIYMFFKNKSKKED